MSRRFTGPVIEGSPAPAEFLGSPTQLGAIINGTKLQHAKRKIRTRCTVVYDVSPA